MIMQIFMLGIFLAGFSCNESDMKGSARTKNQIDLANAEAKRLEVSPQGETIRVGDTKQYIATLIVQDSQKEDVSDKVVWNVSDPRLASINEKGLLDAKSAGAPKVIAKLGDIVGLADLTIVSPDGKPAITSLKITPPAANIVVGEKVFYQAYAVYADGHESEVTDKTAWSAEDESIAVFSSDAAQSSTIQGLKAGKIIVFGVFDGVEGTATLEVKEEVPVALAISPQNASMPIGVDINYKATATYKNGSSKDVSPSSTWLISNQSIAKFTSGSKARTLSDGKVNVSAQFLGLTATTTLTVQLGKPTKITVTPATVTLKPAMKQQYKAVATYVNGKTLDVTKEATWSSSSTAIATVLNDKTSSGFATAVKDGTSNIKAVFDGVTSNSAVLSVVSDKYLLSVSKTGTGAGLVTGTSINCGTTCSAQYISGTKVTLTASVQNQDSYFAGWSGACTGTSTSCTVTMSAARSVTANFKKYVSINVNFQRSADNASFNNCLYVTVNEQPEVYLGCNKQDVNVVRTLTVKGDNICNIFKFRLTSNGANNFSTANPANVRYANDNKEDLAFFKGFKFFPISGGLGAHVNDNGDEKNHTDTSFQITGLSAVNYSIQNTIKACQ